MNLELSKVSDYLSKFHHDYWLALFHQKSHKNIPLRFKDKHYLKQLYMSGARVKKVKKSTQCGVSEWLIVRSFSRAIRGKIVLYVLPTFTLKNQFVQERVNKTVIYTPYYKRIMETDNRYMAESTSMKQVGEGTIAFVGSNTTAAFISLPVDDLIIDELDECNQENIVMGQERQSNSKDPTTSMVANPTVNNFGIDAEYKNSTRSVWTIQCDCGHFIQPDFFKHVIRQVDKNNFMIVDKDFSWEKKKDIRLICDQCERPVDRKKDGVWVDYQKHDEEGYHISKLFSTEVSLRDMVSKFNKSLTNDTLHQRFYNADLGLAFTPQGAKISSNMLDDCIRDYLFEDSCGKVCVAGIDVGTFFHVTIMSMDGSLQYIGAIKEVRDLLVLLKNFNVRMFVIDAMPEKRIATQIVQTMRNGFMCYYAGNKNTLTYDINNLTISTDRTMALDAVKEALVKQELFLPKNAKSIKDFYDHMESSTRIYDEKREVFDWVHTAPDHYFHSVCYMLLAKKLLVAVK